eukprot:3404190-Prymnesium_polylepis.1
MQMHTCVPPALFTPEACSCASLSRPSCPAQTLVEMHQSPAHASSPGSTVVVLATLERGAVLGEQGFFLGATRSATVRSAVLSVVLHLERKDLDDLLKRRSAAAEKEKLLLMVRETAASHAKANQAKIDEARVAAALERELMEKKLRGRVSQSSSDDDEEELDTAS